MTKLVQLSIPHLQAIISKAAHEAAALERAKHTNVSAAQPAPQRVYPKNADGIDEFGVVQLTLDHLTGGSEDGHLRNKFLYTTESLVEALANLMNYYEIDPEVAASASVYEKIAALSGDAADNTLVIFCANNGNPYDSRQGPVFEVLATTPFYDTLVMHPDFGKGSSLEASDQIVRAVAASLDRQDKGPNGEYPVLTLLKAFEGIYPEANPVPPEEAANPCDALSDIPDNDEGTSARGRCYAEAGNEMTGGQGFTA